MTTNLVFCKKEEGQDIDCFVSLHPSDPDKIDLSDQTNDGQMHPAHVFVYPQQTVPNQAFF